MGAKLMTTSTDRKNLNAIMIWLSTLRREALSLPDQSQVGPVLEAIEAYQQELGNFAGSDLVRWLGSAVCDVLHELASAKYGYDSDEAADAEAALESFERNIMWIKVDPKQRNQRPLTTDRIELDV
jgi:hypothetical protein